MTNEEAIEMMEYLCLHEQDICDCKNDVDCADCQIRTAINALKKQIPKKVGHRALRQTEWGSPWHCPECEADLVKVEFMSFDGGEPKNKVSYCWHCGSALDWSED